MTLSILPAGAIAAGVYHTFTDATLSDLVDNADPNEEPGEATFEFGLNFAQVDNRLTTVDLTMRLSIGMPEWPNAVHRPDPEKNEWNRFLRALRVHEDGHIAIFRRESSLTYRRLLAATPATINDVLGTEETRIRGLSDRYDVRTDHGRTQQTPHGNTVITVPAAPASPPATP